MVPAGSIGCYILWCCIQYGIVPPAVLHDNSLYFVIETVYLYPAEIQVHVHLLVRFVRVNVRVGGYPKSYIDFWIHHHEAGVHHFLTRIFIIDRQLVVAAHFYLAVFVGYLKAIMCVKGIGVYRFCHIVNNVVLIESFTEVARKKFCRNAPVGLTMLQSVSVSAIFMGQVVETYIYRVAPMEHGYRWRQPIVANYHLKRCDIVGQYFVALRHDIYSFEYQRQCQRQNDSISFAHGFVYKRVG